MAPLTGPVASRTMQHERYSIPLADLDVDGLLANWSWLVPFATRPIELTLFGDWVLLDEADTVWFLDVAGGELECIATSQAEFEARRCDAGTLDEWFRASLAEDCLGAGLEPGEGECLSYQLPPPVGGPLSRDNVEVATHALHQGLLAQLHAQNRRLSDGTPIRSFVEDADRDS